MKDYIWLYYFLFFVNILVAGLYFATIDFILFLIYLGVTVPVLFLLCWSPVGEFLIIHLLFRAHRLPETASIAPILNEYLDSTAEERNSQEKEYITYYANSKVAYFLPIGKRRAVISIALEEPLIRRGVMVLTAGVPADTYMTKVLFARRLLLLAVLVDSIILRIMELVSIVIALVIRIVFIFVMLIVTGAIFEGPLAVWNAISLGKILGDIVVKINDWCNYLQDKIVELLIKSTRAYTFNLVEDDNRVCSGR